MENKPLGKRETVKSSKALRRVLKDNPELSEQERTSLKTAVGNTVTGVPVSAGSGNHNDQSGQPPKGSKTN
jgi:hypothetical protein